MSGRFAGKTAIVTGASRGIGLAIAARRRRRTRRHHGPEQGSARRSRGHTGRTSPRSRGGGKADDREHQVAAAYPLKRLGVPDDIGSVVAFLLSADAAWMTGQLLVIDGGVTLTGGS